MEQLNAEAGYLDLLLREGKVGSEAFKQAVERQLVFFEEELMTDLLRLEALNGHKLYRADLVARAITRLVFVMGASAASQSPQAQSETLEQTALMLKMLLSGSRVLAEA